ncbi:hypothetical protein AK51_24505 [Serratia nematodiphila DZ0503SBS1]|nr:hypothetical protein AK51_24505 [Serratia nematodiphila DZ0503SBS1]
MHAANLIAKYPQFLRRRAPDRPPRRDQAGPAVAGGEKKIVMAYYDRQTFSEQALALHFANLFGEENQVQTLHFAQGEDAAGSWQARFRRPLQWVLDQAPDATPGV